MSEERWFVYEGAMASGDFQTAHNIAHYAAQFYDAREDFKQAGMWLRALANCLNFQSRCEEAVPLAEKAFYIQPDTYQQVRALVVAAISHSGLLRHSTSFNLFSKAEEISHDYKDDAFLKGTVLGCRAHLIVEIDPYQAIMDAEESAKLLIRSCSLAPAATQINNAGYSLFQAGRLKEAEQRLFYALDILNKAPDPKAESSVYDSLGCVYTVTGRHAEAEKLFRKSISIFRGTGNKTEMIASLLNLSKLHERMHLYKEARADADRALKIAADDKLGSLWLEAKKRLINIESLMPRNTPGPRSLHGIIYSSSTMHDSMARLKNIARTDETVLLTGETGTGKELAARALHLESKRHSAPFIPFNCSALSRDLIESRLFGHRKGSFTGADRDHKGVIRAAESGTLFLDEIGDLSLEAQGALLRFLQSGEIQPVGATRPVNVNVRVIAATHRDLAKECSEGRFRRDLYHRLNVINLHLPPLRFRREDIAVLARHFVALYSQQYGRAETELSRSEIALLSDYQWPGNVRELEGHIKRRILFGLEANEDVQRFDASRQSPAQSWRSLSEEEKRRRLKEAMENNRGNVTRAAAQLGISRRTIQKICRRMQMDQT